MEYNGKTWISYSRWVSVGRSTAEFATIALAPHVKTVADTVKAKRGRYNYSYIRAL